MLTNSSGVKPPDRATALPPSARRDLELLTSIAEDQRTTQRTLSSKLGIALGLTNLYLKRFVRKGYVKCVNVQPNRLRYLLTPEGIAEKTRLTYEFMQYSMYLYQQVRQHLREVLQNRVATGCKRIAIYGTGEAAELAYMSLKELGFEPVAMFDGEGDGLFLGMPVRDVGTHDEVDYDAMLIATLEEPDPLVASLTGRGVDEARLITMRPLSSRSRRSARGGTRSESA